MVVPELCPMSCPPMMSIPAGLCQDTGATRNLDREWDCSHFPALNVRQLSHISASAPPHVVREDCECPFLRPGFGSPGSLQLRPLGKITSAVRLASFSPPVINSPLNKNSKNYRSDVIHKITHSNPTAYTLPILHSSNSTLFQCYTLPILDSSNLTLFQSYSFNLTLFQSYTQTLL